MHRSLLLLCVLLALFVHAMSCPYPVPDEIKAKHFHPSEVPASKVFTTANKEITLAVNDKFMINLEGNPTTGKHHMYTTANKSAPCSQQLFAARCFVLLAVLHMYRCCN